MTPDALIAEFGLRPADHAGVVRLARSFNRMSLKWRSHYPARADKLRNDARDLIDWVRHVRRHTN